LENVFELAIHRDTKNIRKIFVWDTRWSWTVNCKNREKLLEFILTHLMVKPE